VRKFVLFILEIWYTINYF